MIITIKQDTFFGEGYYVQINKDGEHINSDTQIAGLIGTTIENYQDVVVKQFNARIIDGCGTYFDEKEDVEKMAEWLEHQLLAGRLKGTA